MHQLAQVYEFKAETLVVRIEAGELKDVFDEPTEPEALDVEDPGEVLFLGFAEVLTR
tara:strand:- start:105 stop:275 length:171 start_codon:yes stop_codon:yes gene_type:complete